MAIGTGIVVAAVALFALFTGGGSGGGGGGGGGTTPTEPKLPPKDGPVTPPKKPTTPTGPKPKVPTKGPKPKGRGYGGGQWGTKLPPPNFDWDGNQLWISPGCDAVAEGARFMPISNRLSISDENTTTLESALALRSPPNAPASNKLAMNQVYGYIDYLIDTENYQQPEDIVARILSEVSPMCAGIDPTQWEQPLIDWYQSFSDRVAEYVESELTGIPFEPSND